MKIVGSLIRQAETELKASKKTGTGGTSSQPTTSAATGAGLRDHDHDDPARVECRHDHRAAGHGLANRVATRTGLRIGSLETVFMLFGRGGRNFSVARIALLFIVLTAGAVFHYRGAAYWTVRGLYYALIVGFIATAVLRNRGRQRGVGTSGPGTFSGPPFGRGGVQPPFGG